MLPKYSVVIQKPAQLDLDEAFVWYEEKRLGLGFELIADFEKTLLQIIKNPFFASEIVENIRAASLKRFPYEIGYIVDESSKKVFVIVFNHFKREPLWFKGR